MVLVVGSLAALDHVHNYNGNRRYRFHYRCGAIMTTSDGYLENGDLDLGWKEKFERAGVEVRLIGQDRYKVGFLIWRSELGDPFISSASGFTSEGNVTPRALPPSLVSDEAFLAFKGQYNNGDDKNVHDAWRAGLEKAAPHIIAPVVDEIRVAFEKWNLALSAHDVAADYRHVQLSALLTKYGSGK